MTSSNRTIASSSIHPSSRVRQLWQSFEKPLSNGRLVIEHKVNAAKAKADSEYGKTPAHLRMSASQHEETKAKLVKQIKEPYFEGLRAQWLSKLEKAGLKAEDWSDMTQEEMDQVADVLGDDIEEESDEDMVVVGPTPSGPLPQSFSSSFFQPLAPSISSSTRSSNVSSASSYAFVDPSQFHSEDEDDYFWKPVMATSHDLTSDDDDSPGLPVPIHNHSYPFGGWSSDSVASSLQNSVDSFAEIPFSRPPLSNFPQNIPVIRQSTNKLTTSLLSEKEKEKPSTEKMKIRQSYIGPHLDDSNEPLSEADDFELFKMQTRMQKIVEFHQMAALAEVRLAIEIYKERKTPNGETHEVSARVVEHQKRMSELQAAKEEERKATVKAERAKRRSELRTRPGRSNTLVAPKPSVPTNPSWLTNLENSVPAQLEPKFDLSKILSDDPSAQQNGVDKLLQQMFPGAYSSNSPSPSNTNSFHQIPARPRHVSSSSASAWNMSSTSLHSAASGSSSHASHSQQTRRRPSDASRQRGRPSPFGEEDFSDEEDTSPVASPPVNPFMQPDTNTFLSNHLQEDPELAAVFAQYSAIGGGSKPQPSPPVPSWTTKPTIQLPATQQNPWGQKESPGTPVASAWARKKPIVSANPQATPTNLSFAHHFGMSNQNDFMAASTPAISSSIFGKKSVIPAFPAEQEEEEPIWEESPKKVSPPLPPPPSLNKSTTSAQKANIPSKPEPKVEKAAPAPPAPASKKQTKKQRQATKKGNPAAAATNVEELEPPPPAAEEESPEPASQQSPMLEPSPQNTEHISFMTKMIPGMARIRKDSAAASTFSGWDEAVSTPRPASKIPSHLQEAMAPKSEGTPRPNLFKKLHMSESVSSKLANDHLDQSSTIKAPQWGSASTNGASSRVWNLFGSDSSAPKAAAQQPASLFGDHSMHVPGGFGEIGDGDDGGGSEDNDGGGGEEEEAEAEVTPQTQQFWKTPASAWSTQANKTTSPLAQQPVLPAAQRLRRVSEAGNSSSTSRIPVAKAAPAITQPQTIPSPVNAKKGKGKKGAKGKKVMVEEIPDEEGDNRGDILPVDSKVILLPAGSQIILEPKPSKPPRMFNSIISYGDDEEDAETTSSSFAGTPSTAASSPPDPFGGDEARIAAAIKELQEGTSKMERKFGNGAWGGASGKQAVWGPSASEVDSQDSPLFSSLGQRPAAQSTMQQTPVWGQLNGKDKGKGKMTDAEDLPKPPLPTIHNLKRSKATAGGKLF